MLVICGLRTRRGHFDERIHDVLVARATADVSDKTVLNLFGCQRFVGIEHIECRHHDAWRAEPALQTVFASQCLLDGMQAVRGVPSHPFDRRDFAAVGLNREDGA